MSPVSAAYQAAHHSETIHPNEDGVVGFIRKIRVRKLRSPDIAVRKGKAPRRIYRLRD